MTRLKFGDQASIDLVAKYERLLPIIEGLPKSKLKRRNKTINGKTLKRLECSLCADLIVWEKKGQYRTFGWEKKGQYRTFGTKIHIHERCMQAAVKFIEETRPVMEGK
jgi:hypothetical protein